MSTVGHVLLAVLFLAPNPAPAQVNGYHLNPVVEKLKAGETIYGLSTGNFSLTTAREFARAPADFIYLDMEHNPLDFPALRAFLLGMGDKARLLEKQNLQPDLALFARFPPRPMESEWVVKQGLDLGLHGVIFVHTNTAEQAAYAVSTMRYPNSETREPLGIRGSGAGLAAWAWGVSGAEYSNRADLWPLNPNGDLFAMMMIESAEALRNVDAIAATPGVGALFPAGGGDLSRSLGVNQGSPELEAAFQDILQACLTHDVACAITADSADDVIRRVREGWRIIRSNVSAIVEAREILSDAP